VLVQLRCLHCHATRKIETAAVSDEKTRSDEILRRVGGTGKIRLIRIKQSVLHLFLFAYRRDNEGIESHNRRAPCLP
jgi:hypothetical protein